MAEKTTRPTADDEPAAGEFGGPDDVAFHAARRAPRRDFDAMSLAELAEEISARLARASFDFPSWIGESPEERDELETAREVHLEMIADVAEATAKAYAGDGKKTTATREERRAVGEALRRAIAYAALRRHGRDEHGRGAPGRARTEAAAARLVMARQTFRGATAKADRDETDARRDAAVACGDSRVALIRELAKEVPDDVDARGIAKEGAREKTKGRRLLVGGFGARDLPLFEAALGIGGFDATFEAEVRPETGPPIRIASLSRVSVFSRLSLSSRSFPSSSDPSSDPSSDASLDASRVARTFARSALLPPASRDPCALAVFSKRETNVGFFRTPPRNTAEPSPSKHWHVVNIDVFCHCAWGLHFTF